MPWSSLHRPPKALAWVAGAVSALLVIGALVRIFGPSTEAGATLTNARTSEFGLTKQEYCDRRAAETDCSGLDYLDLIWPGFVVTVTAEAWGYAGKELPLRWSMYSDRPDGTDRLLADERFQNQPGSPDGGYVPASDRDRDQNELELWIPKPGTPGQYHVVLELLPDEGSTLASTETTPFPVN